MSLIQKNLEMSLKQDTFCHHKFLFMVGFERLFWYCFMTKASHVGIPCCLSRFEANFFEVEMGKICWIM